MRKKFLVLSVYLLAISKTSVAQVQLRCSEIFNSTTAIKEESLVTITKLFDSDNKFFFKSNEYLGHQDSEMKAFADAVKNLSPEEKAVLVGKIDSLPFFEFRDRNFLYENPRFVAKLILHDTKAWQEFIENVATYLIYPARTMSKKLYPIIKEMPESMKEELLKQIGILYPRAGKINTAWMGPKRVLDALISYMLEPSVFLKKFPNALNGLDQYLSLLNTIIKDPNIGKYGAFEILETAKIIKRHLKPEDQPVYITGSFANGKANIQTSDIDLYNKNNFLESRYADMDKEINGIFAAENRKSKLQLHTTPNTFSLEELASINPILIKITSEDISLIVYPPILIDQKDVTRNGLSYPEPSLTFTINDKKH